MADCDCALFGNEYNTYLNQKDQARILSHIENMRVISAHEHIGSLNSLGMGEKHSFNCDLQPSYLPEHTTLLDLIFSPYFASLLFGMGAGNPPPEAFYDDDAFIGYMQTLRSSLADVSGSGVYVALDRGLKMLHGISLKESLEQQNFSAILALNKSITIKYADYLRHLEMGLEQCATERVLRPVHPSYILQAERKPDSLELAYTNPIARVDSLVGYFDDALILDFSNVEKAAGFGVVDADGLDRMIDWFFAFCDRNKVCAIKQLQAYSRSLAIGEVSREEMSAALSAIRSQRETGALSRNRFRALQVQDYILRRILEEADRRNLPYQIHTGMTTLMDSNPTLLEIVIRRYRKVRFVLLHAYPFISEAAYLARNYSNVWVDTSWLAIQSPTILYNALNEYISMAPASRMTASIDATSLEEYAGGLDITRCALGRVLVEKTAQGLLSVAEALEIAEKFLRDNTKKLYGL